MIRNCLVVVLILALTLDGYVHSGKIYGGRMAAPHSRPYMALLVRHINNGGKGLCGGIILNEDFVLTAAHCQAESYTVFLGINDVTSEKKDKRHVEKAFPRRDFNKASYTNDLMLLKLSSKVKFSKNVGFIDLPDKQDSFLPKSCSVLGWGQTSRSKKRPSHTLMEVNVTLVESRICPKKKYCSEGESGPGEGDSGGPLVCEDGKLYGVVSSSKETRSGQYIYSYAKVPDYRRWIDLIMKNHGKA